MIRENTEDQVKFFVNPGEGALPDSVVLARPLLQITLGLIVPDYYIFKTF